MMSAIMSKLVPELLLLSVMSPLAAIMASFVLFVRRRDRVEPERRVSVIAYVLAIGACGVIGGYVGLMLGLTQACPRAGNLCGLVGVFITGPLCASLAIVLAALAVSSIRPASKPDGGASPGIP